MKSQKIAVTLVATMLAVTVQAQSVSREAVAFTQLVEPDSKIQMRDKGQHQSSRAYFQKITGAQLNNGVEFTVDGENAVLQISPLDKAKGKQRISKTKVPTGMSLSGNNKKRNVDSDEIALHRRSQGLKENYPELYGRAHVMQIPADMGRGKFRLKADNNAAIDDEFIVYVFDKNSAISLDVETSKSRYSVKQRLNFVASAKGESNARLVSVDAQLVSPNGKTYKLPGNAKGNRFSSNWPIAMKEQRHPGELWQLQVKANIRTASGENVQRISEVAVDVYEPTATLQTVTSDAQTVALNLEVAKAGRYEARALVYGTDYDGASKPVLLAYQAQWLVPGQQQLTVSVDTAKLRASGLVAPYTVKSLQLLDQGRMAVLESSEGDWSLK
ncbi:uncharacterized protein DUF4785 [Alteromonadaceae bacterium 2753L.S.0a.02]|nr:uncharacterized protein DUF4785 [Alteromonadaceae bacterium 2753L.S.0a.02]